MKKNIKTIKTNNNKFDVFYDHLQSIKASKVINKTWKVNALKKLFNHEKSKEFLYLQR